MTLQTNSGELRSPPCLTLNVRQDMKLAIYALLWSAAAVASEPIPWQEIVKREVQGELGRPLGNIVEVEAIVVSGRDLFPERQNPVGRMSYFLRISKIAGKGLAKPVLIKYFSSSKMLPDSLGKFAQMRNEERSTISASDIERIESGIVGKEFRILVMEEAVLKGNPKNLGELPPRPEVSDQLNSYDEPITFWQDYWGDFGYHHYVQVLEVLEKKEPNKAPDPTPTPGAKP